MSWQCGSDAIVDDEKEESVVVQGKAGYIDNLQSVTNWL